MDYKEWMIENATLGRVFEAETEHIYKPRPGTLTDLELFMREAERERIRKQTCGICGGPITECDCGGEGSDPEERPDDDDPGTDPRPDPRTHPEYWTE